MIRERGAALASLVAFASACAPVELAPPDPPAQELPAVRMPNASPPLGRGYVVIDTPEASSSVARVTGHGAGVSSAGDLVAVTTEKLVCASTPCVVDMKKGPQTLQLTSSARPRFAELDVTVGDEPVVVRHLYSDLHRGRTFSPGLLLGAIGGVLVLSGGIITLTGLPPAGELHPDRGFEYAGLGVLAGGAVFMIVGGVLAWLGRGTDRPGATTIFTLPPAAPPPVSTSPAAPSGP